MKILLKFSSKDTCEYFAAIAAFSPLWAFDSAEYEITCSFACLPADIQASDLLASPGSPCALLIDEFDKKAVQRMKSIQSNQFSRKRGDTHSYKEFVPVIAVIDSFADAMIDRRLPGWASACIVTPTTAPEIMEQLVCMFPSKRSEAFQPFKFIARW